MPYRLRHQIVRSARAGFTLIELMAVILIIGILMGFLLPRIPEAIDSARVTACRRNMQEIYNGLMQYQGKFDRAPRGHGVRFFAELVYSGTWEPLEATSKKLTCPGVDIGVLSCADMPMDEWFQDPDIIDGGFSSYAGRNTKEHPLRRFPGSGKDPLVADDNDGYMNHRTTTVVLYADGNVGTFELYTLEQEGLITKDEKILVVGSNSPVEVLRKLTQD